MRKGDNMKTAIFSLLALLVLPAGARAEAPVLPPELESRVLVCEKGIEAKNPEEARKCIDDENLVNALSPLDAERAARILSRGHAVAELADMLDKYRVGKDNEAALRNTLSSWLQGVPYTEIGLSSPGDVITWLEAYRPKYSPEKMAAIKKVFLEWGSIPESHTRGALESSGAKYGDNPQFIWAQLTLSARQNLLSEMASSGLSGFIKTGNCMSADMLGDVIWSFLPAEDQDRFDLYIRKCKVMDKVRQLAETDPRLEGEVFQLKGESLDVKIFRLSKFFDNSDSSLGRELDALRAPKPAETIAPEQNQLLAKMLQSSALSALRGVPAGDEVAKFYGFGSGNRFKLRIENMSGDTAEYRPSSGEIVINSQLIQQFMRINGATENGKFRSFTTADLLANKNGAMTHLLNFIAPVIVHEASHQMQHKWSSSRKIFDPYAKEDEVEAISKQSLFVLQKYGKDDAFRKLVDQDKEFSSYMELNVQLADQFERDPVRFLRRVGDIYYPKVPSADVAHAYTLSLIESELARRAKLDEEERHTLETGSLKPSDALNMTNSGLRSSIGEFGTGDLEKLRASVLAGRKEYVERRGQVVDDALQALQDMKGK